MVKRREAQSKTKVEIIKNLLEKDRLRAGEIKIGKRSKSGKRRHLRELKHKKLVKQDKDFYYSIDKKDIIGYLLKLVDEFGYDKVEVLEQSVPMDIWNEFLEKHTIREWKKMSKIRKNKYRREMATQVLEIHEELIGKGEGSLADSLILLNYLSAMKSKIDEGKISRKTSEIYQFVYDFVMKNRYLKE